DLVRRDARHRGEAVVAEEVGAGAAAVEHVACRGVEIAGRRARLGRERAGLVHLRDHPACAPHHRDLRRRLPEYHAYAAPTLSMRLRPSGPPSPIPRRSAVRTTRLSAWPGPLSPVYRARAVRASGSL